jgi:hypothetical protein
VTSNNPEKPLLLVDVDGVLNALGDPVRARLGKFGVSLNPEHGPWLLAFADRMTLTWATMWEHDANRLVGPVVGLPELPVVEFGNTFSDADTFKLADVAAFVGDRAFVWLDDDLFEDAFEWERARNAAGLPTLLVKTDRMLGLQRSDLDKVEAWLAQFATTEVAA